MLIGKLISPYSRSTFKVQGLTSLFGDGEVDGSNIYWVCRHWARLSHTVSHLNFQLSFILRESKQGRHINNFNGIEGNINRLQCLSSDDHF